MSKKAENHLSDLNMAGAIEVLCSHSLFTTAAGQRFGRRIAKLCRDHMQWTNGELDALRSTITALLAERESLQAQLTQAAEALVPFIRHGQAIGAFYGNDGPFRIYTNTGYRDVPVADFHRASEAYDAIKAIVGAVG